MSAFCHGIKDDDFRQIVESTDAGMLIAGDDGRIHFVNRAIEHMFGYERSELLGRVVETLIPLRLRRRHSFLRQRFFCKPSRLYLAGRGLVGAHRDGSEFPVEVGLSPVETRGGAKVVATVVDVSARRRADISVAEHVAELKRENQRLSQFADLACHNLKEPLYRIAAQSELLNEAVASGDRKRIADANKTIQQWAGSARELVLDVLTYSRAVHGDLEMEMLDLRQEIQHALFQLSDSIAATDAETTLDLPSAGIWADRQQFANLICNILSNAIKYHKPEQPPRISISASRANGMIQLSIVDHGIGFDDEFAEMIFEPFRRLNPKTEYPGSGVGLATCKSIADRHGWDISVKSQPGEGAAFFILIPESLGERKSNQERHNFSSRRQRRSDGESISSRPSRYSSSKRYRLPRSLLRRDCEQNFRSPFIQSPPTGQSAHRPCIQ